MLASIPPLPSKPPSCTAWAKAPKELDIAAGELRDWLEAQRAAHPRVLVEWDAQFLSNLAWATRTAR